MSALDPQHFLNFLPLPQGQGSFRPTRGPTIEFRGDPDALRQYSAATNALSSEARLTDEQYATLIDLQS